MLRRARALERDRLEAWKHAPSLRPSFETRARQVARALRMTGEFVAPANAVARRARLAEKYVLPPLSDPAKPV
jgi:hypothetical protein